MDGANVILGRDTVFAQVTFHSCSDKMDVMSTKTEVAYNVLLYIF